MVYILSGPIEPYKGRGRTFNSVAAAYLWHRRNIKKLVSLKVVPESHAPDARRWALRLER